MKPSALLAIALILTACGTVRPILSQDSTRVEVKTVVETVHDTAYVQLPVIVERVATLDTTSVLENNTPNRPLWSPVVYFLIHWRQSPSRSL